MKKNYIKPDIKILKMGTSSIICASSNQEAKNGKFIIGDDDKFEAKYDKNSTPKANTARDKSNSLAVFIM